MRALIEQLESERRADQEALDAIPGSTVQNRRPRAPSISFEQPEQVNYRRSEFGRFYALLIGVQDYQLLDDLASPANDIARIAQILDDRYGFGVLSSRESEPIDRHESDQSAQRDARRERQPTDLFFRSRQPPCRAASGKSAIGCRRNAEPSPDDTLWVPNDFVSRHLGRIDAKRVLVIADSCYSGLLGDDPGYLMVGEGRYTDEYIEWKMPKRSRLVLSSGGDSPIVDDARARAFGFRCERCSRRSRRTSRC